MTREQAIVYLTTRVNCSAKDIKEIFDYLDVVAKIGNTSFNRLYLCVGAYKTHLSSLDCSFIVKVWKETYEQ